MAPPAPAESDRSQSQMWESVFDGVPVSIYVRDRDGRFIGANARASEFIGRKPEELVGLTLHEVLPATQADQLVFGDEEVLGGLAEFVQESPILRADRSTAMVLTVKSPLSRKHDGRVVGTIAYGRDISELRELRRALEEQVELNRSYRTGLESLPEMVYAKDRSGRYTMRNPSYLEYGFFLEGLFREEQADVQAELRRLETAAIDQAMPVVRELVLPTPVHESCHYAATVAPIVDGDQVVGVTVALRDINAMKRVELRLRSEAELDPLTGVRNRRSTRAASEMIAEGPDGLSIVMFDLDHFKRINDRHGHGHGVGDQVLVAVAESVQRSLRPADVLGRWGGEEFVIAVPTRSQEVVRSLAERVHQAVCATTIFGAGDADIDVSVSVGWAVGDPDESFDQVLERADAALYRAKRAGRNRVST